ncbi:probable E3 ubiquitin-protein ligase TRIML1 [Trichosurus vulpecula]|uniref:probable E3 ubiquitin-protein ligase TRIML1 n=1 Tax=Trichosurus vulpecula TaxID=9337 RepID=UPI00186B173B|nr:probable E3 ubiquitin-protein ligase TRIML1 [Trichosurus vulpecula]
MDAKNLIESFKVDLTCFICSGYFTDPVILECGHTFCKECLLSCWQEQHPTTCPNCKAIIAFGDFSYDRKLQNLAIIGKMLRPYLLQSIKDLTTCEKHGKEETLFCEEDHRPLCGPCFLSQEHKEHTVLSLEKAAGQCMEKLQAMWDILKTKREEFQSQLKGEMGKEILWTVEDRIVKKMVLYEYEKMHQFFLEEEQLKLLTQDKEAGDNLAAEDSKASHSQENINLPMKAQQQPVEMFKLESQAMKKSVMAQFEKKHLFLSEQKHLHLQRLEQQVKENLAKFEDNKAKITQHIHNLQMSMSEIEKNFEKLPIEMLLDSKGILERNDELLLHNPVVALPRRTMYPISGMSEMLLTYHREITLDPETANPHLIVSDDLKSVRYVSVPQDVPDNPERFDFALCVLATQTFISGKHYWEIKVRDTSGWEVGIFKDSIRRKGNISNFSTDRCTLLSWGFENYFLFRNSQCKCIFVDRPIHKVGIFLDYERGHVAFYNAIDGTLIYSLPKGVKVIVNP